MTVAPRPLSEWTEDHGAVLWWRFPVSEAPYLGSPLDAGRPIEMTIRDSVRDYTYTQMLGGWPGYHTHWTPLPAVPADPSAGPAPDADTKPSRFGITPADLGRYVRRISTGEVGRVARDPGNGWLHTGIKYEWRGIADDLEYVEVTAADAILAERERIAAALVYEAEIGPCAEDNAVMLDAAWLVRADFSYDAAEMMRIRDENRTKEDVTNAE
ncbi:MAG: hypothetical protein ACRYHQ_16125 [Janthinobacterium lividum]